MAAIYLLCTIASTVVSSFLLSLLLAIRSLPILSRFLPPPADVRNDDTAIILYEGRVLHTRKKPVVNSFEYPVRYALFDLERAPDSSHLSADRAREAAGTDGPVLILTIPRSVGYEMNPIKVYYCYNLSKEEDGGECRTSPRLMKCIAEVTNTPWGEKVFFVFCPGSDMVAKSLHVSPFMDMAGNWIMHAEEPGENLFFSISVQHPTLGNYFFATLSAKRVHSSTGYLSLAKYFWLMPHKVAVWIYWQAIKLWWKNVAFVGHPKYSNPSYRQDALLRDDELRSSRENGRVANHPNCIGQGRSRWCTWRDVEPPWA